MELETIKVKHSELPEGFIIINKTDFDEAVHELYDAEPKAPPAPTAAELKALLDEKGIAYKGNASKAELQALLDAEPKA